MHSCIYRVSGWADSGATSWSYTFPNIPTGTYPKGAIILAHGSQTTGLGATGNIITGASLSWGAIDREGNQRCTSSYSGQHTNTGVGMNRHNRTDCVLLAKWVGSTIGQYEKGSAELVDGGITITFDSALTYDVRIVCVLFFGDDCEFKVGADLVSGTGYSITTGFQPELVFTSANQQGYNNTEGGFTRYTFFNTGAAIFDGTSVYAQYSYPFGAWNGTSASNGTCESQAFLASDLFSVVTDLDDLRAAAEAKSATATGFTCDHVSQSIATGTYMAWAAVTFHGTVDLDEWTQGVAPSDFAETTDIPRYVDRSQFLWAQDCPGNFSTTNKSDLVGTYPGYIGSIGRAGMGTHAHQMISYQGGSNVGSTIGWIINHQGDFTDIDVWARQYWYNETLHAVTQTDSASPSTEYWWNGVAGEGRLLHKEVVLYASTVASTAGSYPGSNSFGFNRGIIFSEHKSRYQQHIEDAAPDHYFTLGSRYYAGNSWITQNHDLGVASLGNDCVYYVGTPQHRTGMITRNVRQGDDVHRAVYLDATSEDIGVTCNSATSELGYDGNTRAISIFFKQNSATGSTQGSPIFWEGNATDGWGLIANYNDGLLEYVMVQDGAIEFAYTFPITVGTEYHVYAKWSSINQRLYLNGALLLDQDTFISTWSADELGGHVRFGGGMQGWRDADGNSYTTTYTDTDIQDAAIWTDGTVKTQDWINQAYQLATGKKSEYKYPANVTQWTGVVMNSGNTTFNIPVDCDGRTPKLVMFEGLYAATSAGALNSERPDMNYFWGAANNKGEKVSFAYFVDDGNDLSSGLTSKRWGTTDEAIIVFSNTGGSLVARAGTVTFSADTVTVTFDGSLPFDVLCTVTAWSSDDPDFDSSIGVMTVPDIVNGNGELQVNVGFAPDYVFTGSMETDFNDSSSNASAMHTGLIINKHGHGGSYFGEVQNYCYAVGTRDIGTVTDAGGMISDEVCMLNTQSTVAYRAAKATAITEVGWNMQFIDGTQDNSDLVSAYVAVKAGTMDYAFGGGAVPGTTSTDVVLSTGFRSDAALAWFSLYTDFTPESTIQGGGSYANGFVGAGVYSKAIMTNTAGSPYVRMLTEASEDNVATSNAWCRVDTTINVYRADTAQAGKTFTHPPEFNETDITLTTDTIGGTVNFDTYFFWLAFESPALPPEEITNPIVSMQGATVSPTTVAGSISETPTPATMIGATLAPTVVLGNISITPSFASASTQTLLAQTIKGSVAIANPLAEMSSATLLGSVFSGSVDVPTSIAAMVGATVSPTVNLGNVTIAPDLVSATILTLVADIVKGSATITNPLAEMSSATLLGNVLAGSVGVTPLFADGHLVSFAPTVSLGGVTVGTDPASATILTLLADIVKGGATITNPLAVMGSSTVIGNVSSGDLLIYPPASTAQALTQLGSVFLGSTAISGLVASAAFESALANIVKGSVAISNPLATMSSQAVLGSVQAGGQFLTPSAVAFQILTQLGDVLLGGATTTADPASGQIETLLADIIKGSVSITLDLSPASATIATSIGEIQGGGELVTPAPAVMIGETSIGRVRLSGFTLSPDAATARIRTTLLHVVIPQLVLLAVYAKGMYKGVGKRWR